MRRARLLAVVLACAGILPAAIPAAAAGHLVRITSTLQPASLIVAPGDRVTWRNDDDERHRIRSTSGPGEFDSGNLEPGESFSVTLSATGRYEYYDDRDRELSRYHGSITVRAGATTTPPPGGGPGATPRPAASTATIAIGDRIFRPASVTITAGGSVTFRNDDDRAHTATGRSGTFDTGNLAPGETARRSFPAAGTFPFLCLLHPDMTGTVTVTGAGGAPPPPPAAPTPTPAPAGPTPDPNGLDAAARIVDFDFEPREIRVGAGAAITWTNVGIAPHTVTATDGSFESGQLDAGESYSATFATPGRFAYLCAIHPSMTGVVVVSQTVAGGPGSSPAPTPSAAVSPPASPGASPGTSPPGAQASPDPGGTGGAGGAAGSPDGQAGEGEPVGAGREIGGILLVVALLGGIVLLAGTFVTGLRSRRDASPLAREVFRPGR